MGSKNRHAKDILPIILKDRKENQWYVEPFVGGCNLIDKVDGKRIGNDYHPHLISMFKAIQDGWIPPDTVSEEQYKQAQAIKNDEIDPLIGFIGFGASYSGKWFGGYARGDDAKGEPRNYAAESKRNIMKQRDALMGVDFFSTSYDSLIIPENSIIYCDPPYQGTTSYKTGDFDHEKFWEWCRQKTREGHLVFVSEYNAPPDFECIWSKTVNNTLTQDTGSKQGVEKLFKYSK